MCMGKGTEEEQVGANAGKETMKHQAFCEGWRVSTGRMSLPPLLFPSHPPALSPLPSP